ncbi:uncharacterized protein LOC110437327 [Sorghum bicolor]|uniref:uncharacterized protein LOC110437327 n=1 Tax=Sorghum bicolor TaxID=4558 RepID=UPI000B4258B3|nr:uncharacterized protein LOC110437327 [Sorghum bicolor]|eukprot:XP_021321419.1 uncharacterized protein LOC110437327 [Sorghum bicolor]
MTEKDPLVLWQSLKDRFSQQLTIVLPRAQQDWINLRFQDFKSVAAYNSALHRIVTKLRLCGQKIIDADMIEKTLSTFQPRQHFVPEAHANVAKSSRNRKRSRGRGKWKGKKGAMFKVKGKGKPKGRFDPKKERGDHSGEEQGDCYRCGAKGHWSRNCRTPKHLVDLYQQSKNKSKGQHESHFLTEPEARPEKHDDGVVGASGDVRMDESEDNHLDDFDIFGDLQ